ncbi:hypothetical protein ABRP70_16360 [Pectobacterium odoriferum]|uniref:Lon N-terminal domain-containing protein n=1 Tax=Pectobacterium odoriferum TaxID=78398 RepID=A0ABR4VUY2_9GAMM|nr:hypothetical protein [Pectobacterium odoriferum]KGA43147.1 hypothetical protein KU75_04650 [Pectobacterium odoriferum]
MSNNRFYIVRICVPEFLLYIPQFLKDELLLKNICPSNYIPIFIVIDRAGYIEPSPFLIHSSARKKISILREENLTEENFKHAKIKSNLAIKKDDETNELKIKLVKEKDEIDSSKNVDIYDFIEVETDDYVNSFLEISCNFLKRITPDEAFKNNDLLCLRNTIKNISILSQKKELIDSTSSPNSLILNKKTLGK